VPIGVPAPHKFSLVWTQGSRCCSADRRVLRRYNRKGCDLRPLGWADCSFATSFAIRLEGALGFAGVV
jgi:hypothetical protein